MEIKNFDVLIFTFNHTKKIQLLHSQDYMQIVLPRLVINCLDDFVINQPITKWNKYIMPLVFPSNWCDDLSRSTEFIKDVRETTKKKTDMVWTFTEHDSGIDLHNSFLQSGIASHMYTPRPNDYAIAFKIHRDTKDAKVVDWNYVDNPHAIIYCI